MLAWRSPGTLCRRGGLALLMFTSSVVVGHGPGGCSRAGPLCCSARPYTGWVGAGKGSTRTSPCVDPLALEPGFAAGRVLRKADFASGRRLVQRVDRAAGVGGCGLRVHPTGRAARVEPRGDAVGDAIGQ